MKERYLTTFEAATLEKVDTAAICKRIRTGYYKNAQKRRCKCGNPVWFIPESDFQNAVIKRKGKK